MANSLSGRLLQINAEQSGNGQNGPWSKQTFVIETSEQFPKKVCFEAWNDKADTLRQLRTGDPIEVFFNPESKEYNSKWYTTLRVWKIQPAAGSTYQPAQQQPVVDTNNFTPAPDMKDDLPF